MILMLGTILIPACLFYAVVLVNFQREVIKGRHKKFHTGNVISFNPTTRQGGSREVYQLESAYFGPFLIVPLSKPAITTDRVDDHGLPARTCP